ncbi:hypothetical protein D3C87_1445450 [compost metagenome]
MPRQKNTGVVFNGTYKTLLRRPSPRKFCTPRTRTVTKSRGNPLVGGPLDGCILTMSDHSCTLPISVGGQTGRYVRNEWHPA